jgi:anthrone oxygenase-like protein
MSALDIVPAIAILSSGIVAGIQFGDRAGPSIARRVQDPSSFVQQQQIVHTYYAKFMPVLSLLAILSALGWLFLLRADWQSVQFWLVLMVLADIAVAFGLTVKVNFPINAQLMTWNVASPPANVKELWSPWEKVHTIRTIFWLSAFVFEVVALTVFSVHKP